MSFVDLKYILLLSTRLRNFKQKSSNLFNFACVFCGDSKIKTSKSRGYIYERNNSYFYFCHNCGHSCKFELALKEIDYRLFKEYCLEKFGDKRDLRELEGDEPSQIPVYFSTDFALTELRKLQRISRLESNHPARQYSEKRKIPLQYQAMFRWCPNFMTWTNLVKPKKFSEKVLQRDEGRILMPFFDKKGKFFAYQGRSIINVSARPVVRYITIVLDDQVPTIFGLDKVDLTKDVYVFEGPIDATFVPNSLAIAGSNIFDLTKVGDRSTFVLCFDNEPRSPETKKKITKAIIQGYRVCIWPNGIVEKDVNDMILKGEKDIEGVIRSNIFSGLNAQTRLAAWSKV